MTRYIIKYSIVYYKIYGVPVLFLSDQQVGF